VPVDLVVTSVEVLVPDNRSGELTTIRYTTVQNQGCQPESGRGRAYWNDYIWISADGIFPPRPGPAPPGIGKVATGRMPVHCNLARATHRRGDGCPAQGHRAGNLFAYIHPDAPTTTITTSGSASCRPAWWPAEHGINEELLDTFSRLGL